MNTSNYVVQKILGYMVLALVAVMGLMVAAVHVANLILFGETWWTPLFAPAQFFVMNDSSRIIGESGLVADPVMLWGALIGIILVLAIAVTFVAVKVYNYRQSAQFLLKDLLSRQGIASKKEVMRSVGASAVLGKASSLRPTLKNPRAEDVSLKLGESRKVPAYISTEESIVLIGPPRSGKGYRILIGSIIDAPGAVITTSTRPDNLAATLAARKSGDRPIAIFDPQGLTGQTSALKWSPITGCEETLVAERRAESIMSSSAMGKTDSNQEWADKSKTIMAQLLHAAAVGGHSMATLAQWVSNPVSARVAVEVLENSGSLSWAGALDSVLSGDPKMLDSNWMGVSIAMRPLMHANILEAMSPDGEENTLHVRDFIEQRGTLYLIGTGSGAGAVGGFLAALMDDMVETARMKGSGMPGGRLDPPLTLVLDEIANLFAWPSLPRVMADGGGQGISTIVVLQSLSQAETGWSKSMAETIWDSATVKLLLGGGAGVPMLSEFSQLMGQRVVKQTSRTYSDSGESVSISETKEAVITVDELRRLPEGVGVLAYKNIRPIVFEVEGWTSRSDAKLISRSKADVERQQQEFFSQQFETKRG